MPDDVTLPAGLPRRIGAMVYDSLLVFAVIFGATIPFVLLVGDQTVSDNQTVVHRIDPAASGIGYQLYLLLVIISFFCWFWINNQQTLGMQAWRLRIVSDSGDKPSLQQCLIRFFGALVSAACLGAGYWWQLFDKQQRSWHDQWSKTHIIYYPKPGSAGSTQQQ